MLDYINKCRRGGAVKRFHTHRIIGENTNAEHQYNATILLFAIFEVTDAEVVRYMLTHDVGEYYTGDVPSSAKDGTDGLRSVLKKAELGAFPLPIISDWDYEKVKMCDNLELLFFIREQRELGNQTLNGVWSNVYGSCCDRLERCGKEKIFNSDEVKKLWNVMIYLGEEEKYK